jgi:protein involved in ribonucleotide reduction
MTLVYWSSNKETTKRFVEKLKVKSIRLPVSSSETLIVEEPFLLLTPSYGSGKVKGAVPNPVIKFLNNPLNRSFIKGVMTTGDRVYAQGYALAGKIIANKCNIPLLYSLELSGFPEDVIAVRSILTNYH